MWRVEHLNVKLHYLMDRFYCFFKIGNWVRVSVSQLQDALKEPNGSLLWTFVMLHTSSKHTFRWIGFSGRMPTSRMSLIRVILWKGRTRNDLRLRLWHTELLSSFLIEDRKSLFCSLEKSKGTHRWIVMKGWGDWADQLRLTADGWTFSPGTSCWSNTAHRGFETWCSAAAQCLRPEILAHSRSVAFPDLLKT